MNNNNQNQNNLDNIKQELFNYLFLERIANQQNPFYEDFEVDQVIKEKSLIPIFTEMDIKQSL